MAAYALTWLFLFILFIFNSVSFAARLYNGFFSFFSSILDCTWMEFVLSPSKMRCQWMSSHFVNGADPELPPSLQIVPTVVAVDS